MKIQLSKPLILILFVILISVGVTSAYAINITLGGTVDITQILNMMGNRITNVGTPIASTDAATKGYVDQAPSTDTLALLGCTTVQIAIYSENNWKCIPFSGLDTIWAGGTFASEENNNYVSFAVVNGKPAMSYHTSSLEEMRYIQASNVDGTEWNAPITINTFGTFGGVFTSLAVINGKPAIAYHDTSYQDLAFVEANDVDGTSWGDPILAGPIPASSDLTGVFNSLAEVNGKPAVSFLDFNNGDLRYTQVVPFEGISTGIQIAVDTDGTTGMYSSLAVINGKPAISYYDETNGNLRYVQSSDADGNAWNTPVTVDGIGDTGEHTSLEVVNGKPAISYYDETNGNLRYVQSSDADGTSWNSPVTVDSVGDTGKFTSLTVVNGVPGISFFDVTSNDLMYVEASNADGTAWKTPVRLDNGNERKTFLEVVNDKPVISHNLKYYQSQFEINNKISCPPNMSQVGSWCIDTIVRDSSSFGNAVVDCSGQGMIVSPVKALQTCDLTNLSTSECGTLTDDGSTQLWTSDVALETSAVDETSFSRIITYDGKNDLVELDSGDNGMLKYFCVKPLP